MRCEGAWPRVLTGTARIVERRNAERVKRPECRIHGIPNVRRYAESPEIAISLKLSAECPGARDIQGPA